MADASILKRPRPRIPGPVAAGPPASAQARAFAMLSHRGRVRHANEDACGARPERGAFIVCDGMGGAAAGEIASHLAMEAFLDSMSSIPNQADPLDVDAPPFDARRVVPASNHAILPDPAALRPPTGADDHPSHPRVRLREAARAANQAVFRHSQKSPSLQGMGTTLVALLFECDDPAFDSAFDAALEPEPASPGDLQGRSAPHRRAEHPLNAEPPSSRLWLVHVGDSRCYRFRCGVLHQLTEDHSLVEEQVRAGLLSRVQAGQSPIRNIITRAIGSQSTVEPEITAQATQPGDLYLLASDGLTRELDDDEIATILCRTAGPGALAGASRNSAANGSAGSALQAALDSACHALIDAANQKGGGDNITVLLVPCP